MKLGLDDPRVPALRYRLTVTGDLAGDLQPPAPPLNLAFDAELEAAVKRFQERHGLTADGAVGPGTRAALNVPVSARIDQIRVNLERARWVLHEIQGEFVLVERRRLRRLVLPRQRADLDLESDRRSPVPRDADLQVD